MSDQRPSDRMHSPRVARDSEGELDGRILHVDDDRVSREVVGEWLRIRGFTVWLAGSPGEADMLMAIHDVELVLSDIHMDGNERLEWVERLLQRTNGPAIVLLTGNPEFETACRAANLPVGGYLLKPPNFAELGRTVNSAIAARRHRTSFLSLSREILDLLSARTSGDPTSEHALVERLSILAAQFAASSAHPEPAGALEDATWRNAIEDTIAVIQKTKDSFRSKDLGQLRARLQQLLDATAPKSRKKPEKA